MNPAELARLFTGFAEYAENLAIESELVDAAGERVRGIQNLIGSGGDADGPGGPRRHRASGGGGFVADGGTSVGWRGHVDGELAEEFSGGVENLDAAVAAVGNINIVLHVDGNAVWRVELAGLRARFAPGHQPVSVFVDFCDARVDVAVADVGAALGVPRDVRHLSKHAVDGRQRRLHVLQRFGAFIGSLLLAAKNKRDAAGRIEFNDHVRAFVRDPDVVVFVDFHGVGKGPGIEMMANLAKKFSVRSEFQKLRSGRSVGGPSCAAARKHKNVALGVDGDARGFAKVKIGRELEEIGDRMVADFRWLLSENSSGDEKGQSENEALHESQPPTCAMHHVRPCEIIRRSMLCIGRRSGEQRKGDPGAQAGNRRRACSL